MRCRTCDYPLWNLPGRSCPECGTAFSPKDYDFVPGAVQFLCPHCKQSYFGTTATGQLDPSHFACVECKEVIDVEDMALLPADGIEESSALRAEAPWCRSGIGLFKRWLFTLGWSFARPEPLIQGIPTDRSASAGWIFYWINTLVIIVFGMLPFLVVIAFSIAGRGGGGRTGVTELLVMGAVVLGSIIATTVLTVIWILLTHATLAVFGGCPFGLRRTTNAMLFASGPQILNAIPCLGLGCLGQITPVWWAICAIFSVKAGQRVSAWRASIAVLWPILLIIVIAVGVWTFMVLSATSAAQMTAARMTMQMQTFDLERQMTITQTALLDDAESSSQFAHSLLDVLCASEPHSIKRNEMLALIGVTGTAEPKMPSDELLEAIEQIEDPSFTERGADWQRIGEVLYCLPDVKRSDLKGENLVALICIDPESQTALYVNLEGEMTTYLLDLTGFASRVLDDEDRLRASVGLAPIGDVARAMIQRATATQGAP